MKEQITGNKVVGTKQTLKALQKENVKCVYVAKDAETKLIDAVIQLAKEKNVKIIEVDSMVSLGKACEVHSKTASAATIGI